MFYLLLPLKLSEFNCAVPFNRSWLESPTGDSLVGTDPQYTSSGSPLWLEPTGQISCRVIH